MIRIQNLIKPNLRMVRMIRTLIINLIQLILRKGRVTLISKLIKVTINLKMIKMITHCY